MSLNFSVTSDRFVIDNKARVAQILRVILWAIIILVGLRVVTGITLGGDSFTDNDILANSLTIVVSFGLLFVVQQGYIRAAGITLAIYGWANISYQAWNAGGVRDSVFIAYLVIVLFSGLVMGWRTSLIFTILSIGATWGFAYAESFRLIEFDLDSPYQVAFDLSIIFALIAVVFALALNGLNVALRQTQASQASLIERNRELEAFQQTLEERIAGRTEGLKIVSQMSERLNAILEVEQLMLELVEQVKRGFNYYHAHVYLYDESQQNLVMMAGAGEAGQKMKAAGHAIATTASSLVAQAARTGNIVVVNNVHEDSNWLPNPLLPDTHSEMAIPIILQSEVVGVLDVQQNKTNAFDAGDTDLLRTLANQVAVSIRNAQLFTQTETILDETRQVQEQYIQQQWQSGQAAQGIDYLYTQTNAPTLAEQIIDQAKQYARHQDRPTLVEVADQRAVTAPVKLGDRKIGTLQLHNALAERSEQVWSEQDLELVEAVVDQVAQAAERLRLFEETRERATREATIREITDKLRAAPNLDVLLETAARELGSRLGVRHTVLELGINNKDT